MRPTCECPDNFRESLTKPTATFAEIFYGLLFRLIVWTCIQNLKFVALPVPEIIGCTAKCGQSLLFVLVNLSMIQGLQARHPVPTTIAAELFRRSLTFVICINLWSHTSVISQKLTFCLSFEISGDSANAVPHYHKFCTRLTHIWGNRRGQPNQSAMEGPRPGGSALLITESPVPGKYDFSLQAIPVVILSSVLFRCFTNILIRNMFSVSSFNMWQHKVF